MYSKNKRNPQETKHQKLEFSLYFLINQTEKHTHTKKECPKK
jgi:hypothetical protein